jgi:hypothetical protein
VSVASQKLSLALKSPDEQSVAGLPKVRKGAPAGAGGIGPNIPEYQNRYSWPAGHRPPDEVAPIIRITIAPNARQVRTIRTAGLEVDIRVSPSALAGNASKTP